MYYPQIKENVDDEGAQRNLSEIGVYVIRLFVHLILWIYNVHGDKTAGVVNPIKYFLCNIEPPRKKVQSNIQLAYGNTQGYGVNGSVKGGSLIRPLTKELVHKVKRHKDSNSNNKNNDNKNKDTNNVLSKPFLQLLQPVERKVHKEQLGNGLLEITMRLSGRSLYLGINS